MARIASKRARWRDDEIAFIQEHYGHLPISEIAKELNRSVSAIYQRASILQLLEAPVRATPIIKGEVVFIPLTGKYGVGKYAKADLADFDQLFGRSWHVSKDGYARASITYGAGDKRQTKMHHLVLPLQNDGREVDHINRDKLDNRRENLRLVTRLENILNSDHPIAKHFRADPDANLWGKPVKPAKTIPHYAIWWCNSYQKWRAYIQTQDKRVYVGSNHSRNDLEVLCAIRLEDFKSHSAR